MIDRRARTGSTLVRGMKSPRSARPTWMRAQPSEPHRPGDQDIMGVQAQMIERLPAKVADAKGVNGREGESTGDPIEKIAAGVVLVHSVDLRVARPAVGGPGGHPEPSLERPHDVGLDGVQRVLPERAAVEEVVVLRIQEGGAGHLEGPGPVSYTHLRAHET